ncbi:MAG: hypothetical protein RJQ04_19930 [Longimicrobiales bacterium]
MYEATGWRRWMAIGVACAAVSCGDEGPEVVDLTGTWDATDAVVTNPAVPGQSADLMRLGLAFTLVIGPDGSAEATIDLAGDRDVEHGTITLTGPNVTLMLDGQINEGTWSLRGNRLTLDLRRGVEFDFDGTGQDEPATLLLVLVRRG